MLGNRFGFMSSILIWGIGMKLENGSQNPNIRKNEFAQSTTNESYFLRYRRVR